MEGMSDEMKKEADNLTLSEKRAESVADELVVRGVDPDIIMPAAYGDACGEKKKTKKDNRVKIRTLETAEGCYGCPFACEQAMQSGLVPQEALKYMVGSDYCFSNTGD